MPRSLGAFVASVILASAMVLQPAPIAAQTPVMLAGQAAGPTAAPTSTLAGSVTPFNRGWNPDAGYRLALALRLGKATSARALLPRRGRSGATDTRPDDAESPVIDYAAVIAAAAVGTADQLVGAPYRWGGSSPAGFDCSGFVQYIFRQQGIELPRVSRDQAHAGTALPTSLDGLEPGDLLFFAQRGPSVDHVAIYAGDGRIVHSSRSGFGVRYDELTGARGRYYAQYLVAVRRVFDATTLAALDAEAGAESAALSLDEALEVEVDDAAPPPEGGM